jgi:hypothetical protein
MVSSEANILLFVQLLSPMDRAAGVHTSSTATSSTLRLCVNALLGVLSEIEVA